MIQPTIKTLEKGLAEPILEIGPVLVKRAETDGIVTNRFRIRANSMVRSTSYHNQTDTVVKLVGTNS